MEGNGYDEHASISAQILQLTRQLADLEADKDRMNRDRLLERRRKLQAEISRLKHERAKFQLRLF